MNRARIPNFYKLSVSERVRLIHERGLLSEDDYQALAAGKHTLKVHHADKMIENVIGVMGLPIGLALNFLINGKDYVIPLVVEEPSIVAALCSAAKLIRTCGGFQSVSQESILIGQVQTIDVPHPREAQSNLLRHKEEILNLANSFHPNLVARGGGAKDLEVWMHVSPTTGKDMVVLHLLVDTCDAMGANLVNTMCEGVASLVENITGGRVLLRILSNLTDRALVRTQCLITLDALGSLGYDAVQVRDGIILANDLATVDPYRAATHNKGIMNGIDAVALATGNDWRALEAAAHAYAGRGHSYASLTRWYKNEQGHLVGLLEIPIKVGIVGGQQQANPTVLVNQHLLGARSARELAEIMGAVGLGQNFSALRALVTDGIQQGHMTLHARSVALAAGAGPELFETVVDRLIDSGEIKVWKAHEIIQEVKDQSIPPAEEGAFSKLQGAQNEYGVGHGKVILLGEHAVVYGSHALTAPIPLAIRCKVKDASDGVTLIIPRWGIEQRLHLHSDSSDSFHNSIKLIIQKLGLEGKPIQIEIFSNVPKAMGLGGSAATAVATIRAMDLHFKLGLKDNEVNSLAFECEKVAHGTPSGVDNTVATYGQFLVYRAGPPAEIREIHVKKPIPIVIGMTHIESLTAKTVRRVRQAWRKNKTLYDEIFKGIDRLVLEAVKAVENHDLEQLGDLMNVCQGLLGALQVSSPELETLIEIARENGALGAKLTGGGGGGSIIAVCPNDTSLRVIKAMQDAGYQAMEVQVG
ncbi:MAG: hydroxymethylglutaryl-CoA reductase, degradative [Gammaproteobacteria bacterium]